MPSGALEAPPKRFAQDAIGAQLADVDRTIGDAALDRLGFLSGQSAAHLLDGTLRPDIKPFATESRRRVHQAVALHGDLILQRRRGGQCFGPITQYCPVCLVDSRTAYLRRGWQFLRLLLIDDLRNIRGSGVGPLLVELREIGSVAGVSLGCFATREIADRCARSRSSSGVERQCDGQLIPVSMRPHAPQRNRGTLNVTCPNSVATAWSR